MMLFIFCSSPLVKNATQTSSIGIKIILFVLYMTSIQNNTEYYNDTVTIQMAVGWKSSEIESLSLRMFVIIMVAIYRVCMKLIAL